MTSRLFSFAVLTLLLSFGWNSLNAQLYLSDDVLYLHSGDIIRGRILSQDSESIRIELLGGTVLVYRLDEVERIQDEPSPFRRVKVRLGYEYRKTSFRERGLYHIVSLDWSFNQNQWNETRLDPHLRYAAGYHFDRYVNLGLGTGLDSYEGGLIIPWYVDFRGDLWEKKVTPTYYANLGYGFVAAEGWPVDNMTGGVMMGLGVGWKINTPRKAEWLITLGYKIQNTYQERSSWGWWDPSQSRIAGTRQYRKVVFQTALAF